MNRLDIKWNEPAREKILADADRVLQDAVLDLAATMDGADSDSVFAALNARLKDRFIDYEPGPDVRKFSDAVADGQIHP